MITIKNSRHNGGFDIIDEYGQAKHVFFPENHTPTEPQEWESLYPLNTFSEETQKEIIALLRVRKKKPAKK